MRDQLRLVAWLLMVVGGLILVVSALADPLALGMPGSSFGLKQLAGCVLGALIAFGGWRFHRRLDRADARDHQRARQRQSATAQRPLATPPTPAAAAPQGLTRPTPPPGYASDRDAPPVPPAPQIRSNLAETRAMADTTELPRLPNAANAWDDDDTVAMDEDLERDAHAQVRDRDRERERERRSDAADDTGDGTGVGRGSGRR